MPVLTDESESALLSRVIERAGEPPPAAARFLLRLDFTRDDRARMNELAAKSREGCLSASERRELDRYLRVGDLLALWHAKARRAIRQSGTEPSQPE